MREVRKEGCAMSKASVTREKTWMRAPMSYPVFLQPTAVCVRGWVDGCTGG